MYNFKLQSRTGSKVGHCTDDRNARFLRQGYEPDVSDLERKLLNPLIPSRPFYIYHRIVHLALYEDVRQKEMLKAGAKRSSEDQV